MFAWSWLGNLEGRGGPLLAHLRNHRRQPRRLLTKGTPVAEVTRPIIDSCDNLPHVGDRQHRGSIARGDRARSLPAPRSLLIVFGQRIGPERSVAKQNSRRPPSSAALRPLAGRGRLRGANRLRPRRAIAVKAAMGAARPATRRSP
jgi:hypothetical protein